MIPTILHIGLEKTGTTSIQNFLNRNRQGLLHRGILFPRAPGEFSQKGLTCYALNDNRLRSAPRVEWGIFQSQDVEPFRATLASAFRQELAESQPMTVVLSDEHLSSHLIEACEISRIHELMLAIGLDTRILIYLRRQDEFLLSSYSTFVRNGRTEPLEIPTGPERINRYDYHELLGKWAGIFGKHNIKVRIFEPNQLVQRDAVHDFCASAGIDINGLELPPRLNERIDAKSLEFARLFNQHVPRLKHDGRPNPLRGNFYDAIGSVSSGQIRNIRGLTEFYLSFQESNNHIATDYCGDKRPLFTEKPHCGSVADAGSELTLHEAVRIAAELWKVKQRQVIELRKKIHELEKQLQIPDSI